LSVVINNEVAFCSLLALRLSADGVAATEVVCCQKVAGIFALKQGRPKNERLRGLLRRFFVWTIWKVKIEFRIQEPGFLALLGRAVNPLLEKLEIPTLLSAM